MNDDAAHELARIAGQPLRHESAHLHVSGRALYTDDIALPPNTLHAAFGISRVAHGRITSLDLAPVLAAPGVVAIATPADIPGENNYGGIIHDDPDLRRRAGAVRRPADLRGRRGQPARRAARLPRAHASTTPSCRQSSISAPRSLRRAS